MSKMDTYKIAFNSTITTINTGEEGIDAVIKVLESMNIDCEVYILEDKIPRLIRTMYKFDKNDKKLTTMVERV